MVGECRVKLRRPAATWGNSKGNFYAQTSETQFARNVVFYETGAPTTQTAATTNVQRGAKKQVHIHQMG